MEERHRFSASPVNFDRFVSLQRSSSRSLSPDRELHQMLRPYQLHTTHNSSSTAGAVGTKKHRKAERRSTDMVDATASGGVLTVDGGTTQAATPPSRSASGGAASTSTATSGEMSRHPASAHAAPQYYVVEEEAVDFDRSSSNINEEVDLLLRAAQQLGGPLYNPVTQQFVCWKLHVLERRSRASYGDIEGVSCDFCGHTDWLDSVQEEEEDEKEGERAMPSSRTGKLKGVKQETKEEEQEDSSGVHHLSALPAHSRYLYHCPICAVDICRACLAEVQADERFHVPCLQCQRCGTFETRPNAPVHQCRPKHAKVETPGDAKAARSWLPSPAPAPPEAVAPHAAPKPQPPRIFGGSTVRNLVRLGLSRSGAGGGALHAATRSAPEEPTQVLSVEPPYTPITSPDALSRAALRKRSSTLRSGGDGIVARAKAEEKEEGVLKEAAPQRRWQGAMPSRVSQARSDGDALQSPSPHAPIPSTARYEVHLRPQSTEDVDEVHRIAREQHLQLLPPPAAAKTSVAYFPTRLAAESCVDRAAAGSIEALLKRYIRDA